MAKDAEALNLPDPKPVGNSPLVYGPPLELNAPRIDGPLYDTLEPGHPLYELAAWAHHHAPRLPTEARRGLFLALSRAWPRPKPRRTPRDRGQRAIQAAWLVAQGQSVEDVAAVLCVAPDSARRLIAIGDELRPHVFTHPEYWSVDAVADGTDRRPEDPASLLAWQRMKGEDLAHAVTEDLRLAETAVNGHSQLVAEIEIVSTR
jgi:hypothetical protein